MDTSFGDEGIEIVTMGSINNFCHSLALQADGKIVAAGLYQDSVFEFALARFNENGSLDSSFGSDGTIITAINSGPFGASSVAIQVDGKIVAAGSKWYNPPSTAQDFTVIRYNYNGTLDSSFGTNAIAITDLGGYDVPAAIAIQADGKIIVAGGTSIDFAIVRYNTDGSLDSSFGIDGKSINDFYSWSDAAGAIALEVDGKILEAGTVTTLSDVDFGLIQYNTDGTLDSTFGSNGKLTADFDSRNDQLHSLAIQPDGKIIAAGASWKYLDTVFGPDFAIARFYANGAPDSSFGTDGRVITSIDGYQDGFDIAYSVALQPDGKIILAGSTRSNIQDPGYEDFALVRYNPDGSLDSSFGVNGQLVTVVSQYTDIAYSMIYQPDGKIVLGGTAPFGQNLYPGFALARYVLGINAGVVNFTSSQITPFLYPNPIQQNEILHYTLTQNEVLTLRLYDENGRMIKTFFTNKWRMSGEHTEELNFGNLAAGIYLLTLGNGLKELSVKMVKQ
jgi:uncharacterized delta-60 repeat protein